MVQWRYLLNLQRNIFLQHDPFAQHYYLFCRLIFTLFPDTYRPGACERDVCYTSWESLRDCRCGGTGVDQSHWKRGNNTHTHTLCQWSEQDDWNSVRFPSDSGGQGEVVLLNESCQSRNRAGHGSKQCHGRVSASVVFFLNVYVEFPIQIFIISYLILMTEFEYFPNTDTKSTVPAGSMSKATWRNKPHNCSYGQHRQMCVIIICLRS